jgi:hypothetical protein
MGEATMRRLQSSRSVRGAACAVVAAAAPLLGTPTTACAEVPPRSDAALSLHGWFPEVRGQTRFTGAPGGGGFVVDVGDLLGNLEMTFQGTLDLRQGDWGALVDVVYMSVGTTRDALRTGTVGGVGMPAGASAATEYDNKTRVWTVAAYYRAIEVPGSTLDVVAGLRYLDIRQTLDWAVTGNVGGIPGTARTGSGSARVGNADLIVGLRGRVGGLRGSPWFFPWYVDMGTGESDLTWQVMGGVGHVFRWGEAVLAWRYMEYRLGAGAAMDTLTLTGPMIGATLRW